MAYGSYLFNRDGVYQYVRPIPKDLQATYGKALIRVSLRTKDKRTAITERNRLNVAYDAAFADARNAVQRNKSDDNFVQTDDGFRLYQQLAYIKQNIGMTIKHEHGAIEAPRPWLQIVERPRSKASLLKLLDDVRQTLAYEEIQAPTHISSGTEGETDGSFLVPARYRDAMSAHYAEMRRQEAESLASIEAALQGTKPIPAKRHTLTDVLDMWKDERKPVYTSINSAEVAIREFQKITKHGIHIDEITAAHGRAFKEHVMKLARATSTKEKHWRFITLLLKQSISSGLLTTNPFDGLMFNPKPDKKERSEFTPDDLNALFNHLGKEDKDWWHFRILTYTGARLAEVHQLTAADIKVNNGHHYFDFNEADGKRLKNKGSRRRVPIHPQLMRDGLLDWLPRKGVLFDGTASAASKRLLRHIRAAGIKDGTKVVHSLRHGFKSACRVAGIPEEIHDRLTGHASPTIGRTYGKADLLEILKQHVDTIHLGIEIE